MSALAGRRPALRVSGARARARIVPAAALALLSVFVLVQRASLGDYEQDAGPSLRALVEGHVGRAIELQPLMGSFAVLARAPFALIVHLAGGGELELYRAGVVACSLAVAALGLALARRADGQPWALAVPVIALLTPASIAAAQAGHPEEGLAGALLVGAVLAADRSALATGLLLGLAVATKQWALVGVAPVLWLVPYGRRRVAGAVAAGTALLLTLPLIVGGLGAFSATSHQAATSPQTTGRATVWFLLAHRKTLHLPHVPAGVPSTTSLYLVPGWVARGAHPAIVVLPLLLALLVWRRRPTTADALALLTLALLARCVLDPVDNDYYHLPFLLALLAYEVTRRRPPVLTLFASAALWLTFDRLDMSTGSPAVTNAAYLAWTAAVGALLVHALWKGRERASA